MTSISLVEFVFDIPEIFEHVIGYLRAEKCYYSIMSLRAVSPKFRLLVRRMLLLEIGPDKRLFMIFSGRNIRFHLNNIVNDVYSFGRAQTILRDILACPIDECLPAFKYFQISELLDNHEIIGYDTKLSSNIRNSMDIYRVLVAGGFRAHLVRKICERNEERHFIFDVILSEIFKSGLGPNFFEILSKLKERCSQYSCYNCAVCLVYKLQCYILSYMGHLPTHNDLKPEYILQMIQVILTTQSYHKCNAKDHSEEMMKWARARICFMRVHCPDFDKTAAKYVENMSKDIRPFFMVNPAKSVAGYDFFEMGPNFD